jgi:hypothetical protein
MNTLTIKKDLLCSKLELTAEQSTKYLARGLYFHYLKLCKKKQLFVFKLKIELLMTAEKS